MTKFKDPAMRRTTPLLLLLFLLGLLQGCSAVRFGYGHADSLARWWIDQYVDLSPEQDSLVQERLPRFFAWHRKTQLPDYVAVLRQGQQFIAGQPTLADARALDESIVRRVRTAADQAIPDVADLLASLGPSQIDRIAARYAEKNLEYAKEAGLSDGEAAQRKARQKRILERAEYWFGDVNGDQRASLQRMIDAQESGAQFRYEERLRRQRELLDLARQVQREKPTRERVIQLLRDYAARFDLPPDAARRTRALALRRAAAELTVAVLAMTTPAQRAHARQKLDDLIGDFTQLSQEAS
ncbi:DUF6279 family lipoprotein [Sulfuritalea sp.]|uniref:DUF6279 family lipoprotein n=1 Tax=Sulfuritalea sp. TaxID=2480090 RepID=UPI001AD0456D|nr:DUF6279 family lipoprotein [Sulfuritalea sp.]MBN8474260.1 hypothetical protein [Sulfuritalea sp.]